MSKIYTYEHPLVTRYSSNVMTKLWSQHQKIQIWRELWIALAEGEKKLGLNISDEQINQMKQNVQNINFEFAAQKEAQFRHDVMAHIHTFGEVAPLAKPIIHLGATSCFVTDNSELWQIKNGLNIIISKLIILIQRMYKLADKYKHLPTLGFTHYQPAQLTTVGKRICLWIQDFIFDFNEIMHIYNTLPFRGVKGTTGTQASFLALFNGDHQKVLDLDKYVAERMGFTNTIPVSGQTYTRKIDYYVTSRLSSICQSAHKMCTDIRLLANLREMEEPFGKNQIGSSAMAYKRNPMKSERVCSLARYVMNLTLNTAQTHSVQWFERTLDDSANRRMVLPESFLGTDAVLNIAAHIMDGLIIWPRVIEQRVKSELPFMATEHILMACVKAGGDRQQLHEEIRSLSMQSSKRVKEDGASNDLLERIRKCDAFKAIHDQLDDLLNPNLFIGRCPQQVDEFLSQHVQPLLDKYESFAGEVQELVV